MEGLHSESRLRPFVLSSNRIPRKSLLYWNGKTLKILLHKLSDAIECRATRGENHASSDDSCGSFGGFSCFFRVCSGAEEAGGHHGFRIFDRAVCGHGSLWVERGRGQRSTRLNSSHSSI